MICYDLRFYLRALLIVNMTLFYISYGSIWRERSLQLLTEKANKEEGIDYWIKTMNDVSLFSSFISVLHSKILNTHYSFIVVKLGGSDIFDKEQQVVMGSNL